MAEIDDIREQSKESGEKRGDINGYTCTSCHKTIFTIVRETGTTPYMITCRACGTGTAKSQMYRIPRIAEADCTHEWIRPDSEEALMVFCAEDHENGIEHTMAQGCDRSVAEEIVKDLMMEHWRGGGLFLRKIVEVDPAERQQKTDSIDSQAQKEFMESPLHPPLSHHRSGKTS